MFLLKGMTMNAAQKAFDLLSNQVTIDDLRKLDNEALRQFLSICNHWSSLASVEQNARNPDLVTPWSGYSTATK